MSTYNEVLNQIPSLPPKEQIRLLDELKKIIYYPVEIEGNHKVISAEEIAESEATLQAYLAGIDSGISSQKVKLKLF